ncbi:DMT family transporter [Comamonas sp.]|uniref:DMT family transporter n=1 Tax=Comamonas sp. TaxID=34028 RepID=UPI003A8E5CE1
MKPISESRSATPLLGIVLTLGACASFSVLDAGAKYVGAALPLLMALWLRYALQTSLTLGYGLFRHGLKVFCTAHWRFQLVRALLFCLSNACAMMSLRYLPLAEFTAIVAMTPLAMTLVAALWLRQRVSPLRWVLVALGFTGTLIIVRPGGTAYSGAALLWPLLQLAANTSYQIVSSRMAGKEKPLTTQIYTSLFALLLTSVSLPWIWTASAPLSSPAMLAGIAAMGVGSAIGHLLMLKAYEYAKPATITPYLYSQILFAAMAGWLLYRHIPDQWAVMGMLIIALGGALSAWLTVRESR